MDSIRIDPLYSETVLNALLAVYNSSSPARDTVVDLLNIHEFPSVTLRGIAVSADSTLPWMQELRNGIIPTGTEAIDQLLSDYEMSVQNYHAWTFFGNDHTVALEAGSDLNVLALAPLFANQFGVSYAEPNGGCCDGNRIIDSVYTDHVNLIYVRAWGDCPAGCTAHRYWEFNVLPDCSVEFVGSYGEPLDLPNGVNETHEEEFAVFPNPTHDKFTIQWSGAAKGMADVRLFDLAGQLVWSGRMQLERPFQMELDSHAAGTYLLSVDPDHGPARFVKVFIGD